YVAIKINYFSLGERYDRFLVPRSAARQNTSLCITGFLLTHHILCIHALHIHSILLLYGSLDVNLIGIHIHDETVFSFLIESGNFLSNQWSLQNTHYCLFNKVSILLNELSTKITLSACITSYVLMLSAVVIFVLLIFLPLKITFLF